MNQCNAIGISGGTCAGLVKREAVQAAVRLELMTISILHASLGCQRTLSAFLRQSHLWQIDSSEL